MTMYKALYDFDTNDVSALSFHFNDTFSVLDTSNPHWWMVQNGTGKVGYVPGNYLAKDESHSLNDVLLSIDRAISAIHSQYTAQGGEYTAQQKSNLQKLVNHKENVLRNHQNHTTSRSVSMVTDSETVSQSPRRSAPHPPPSSKSEPLTHQVSRSSKKGKAPAPPSPRDSSLVSDHHHIPPITASSTDQSQPIIATETKSSQLVTANDAKSSQPIETAKTRPETESVAGDNDEHSKSQTTTERTQPLAQTAHFSPARYSTSSTSSTNHISDTLYSELVNCVRNKTNISYDNSKVAVAVVISELRDRVPMIREIMEAILNCDGSSPDSAHDHSEDGIKLRRHLNEVSACKDDSQQRSWFLHEDEATISEHLQGILDILDNANPDICQRVVVEEQLDTVHDLVLYYQMETRVSIRLLLLQVFGALCGVDVKVVSELLNSVLPLELARDMQADPQDIQKFIYSSLVLVMIFSMGETLPVRHYDHLNDEFIQFLLDTVESPPDGDLDDQLPDLMVQIILSFNLHFEMPTENRVLGVLARQETANNFLEKLMLLVNREADPVRILQHKPCPTNSVLKFLSDMYSSDRTANLLYTNDAKVLLDIILRHLRDLCPGDKMRTEYLSLFHLILKSSNYGDHCHRLSELQKCFVRISQSEDYEVNTDMDKLIVKQIWKDFSHWFEPS